MDRPLRVLVVDDHELILLGFRALLDPLDWIDACLTAGDGDTACALAGRHEPHVAVVDLFLGDETGTALGEQLREASPTTQVLFVSGVGWISPRAAKAVGASGFVSKDRPAGEIAEAIHAVGSGRTVFSAPAEQPRNALSPRERQVLGLLATGATNREIAERLHLSPHTIKEHTSALYRKLAVRNRAEAVQRAERLGLTASRS
jgi:DNA-binding NarL/FixJ family response regulator